MNGGSPPDPMQSSMTQSMFNTQAAQQQQRMNMLNQSTPYGQLKYTADPNSPGGYTATQTLTPEMQSLLDSNTRMAQGSSDTGNALLQNAQGAMSQPLDLSYGANAQRIAALQQKTLDPQWDRNQNTFDQTMANRGIVPGSAAYDNAQRDYGTNKSDAYNSMFLKSYDTANNAATQQYNSPFNALASLRSGSQVAQPVQSMGFTTTPQESIQAPNYMGAVQSQYQQQMGQDNAAMGGLFGLGGTLLKAGLPLMMASDRRLKTDISRVGTLDNGLPVYAYRYKSGGPMQIGLMAQDVEKVNPDAVGEIAGFKAVDYARAVV